MSAECVVSHTVTYPHYTLLSFRISVDSTTSHITYLKLHQNGSVATRYVWVESRDVGWEYSPRKKNLPKLEYSKNILRKFIPRKFESLLRNEPLNLTEHLETLEVISG